MINSDKNYKIALPELLLNHLLKRAPTSFSRCSSGRSCLFVVKKKALIMYKTLNELAPDYLQCLFTQRHVNDYHLRDLEGKLSLPKPNTNYLKRSFCYSGACLWNNLPQDLKSVASVGQFKRGIKKVSEISDSHTAIMYNSCMSFSF